MSIVTRSQGESMASTILSTPSGVRPRPQWFSRPSVTPHFSAVLRHAVSPSITHLKPSSSVNPGCGGSIPRFFISSSKFLLVRHVPVLTRIVGMPIA